MNKIKASDINWKIVAASLTVVWLAITGVVYSLRTFITVGESAGQIGDMFGAANALFSGLAILGLLYTILQQREDLDMQRDELRLTREEHARAAAAQLDSADALARQAESLKQAARISAIQTLVTALTAQISEESRPSRTNAAVEEREGLLAELTEIVRRKE